jgi:hypothetical protein
MALLSKAQVNVDVMPRHVYIYIGGGGGWGCWGYYFFRIHVKGVIEFFCNVGGQHILFSC